MTSEQVISRSQRERAWIDGGNGLSFSLLRSDESGWTTLLLRFAAGARGALHDHPGGEELYVVSGRIRVGDRRLSTGDYLFTPPGGIHDAEAEEETTLFLVTPRGINFLQAGGAR